VKIRARYLINSILIAAAVLMLFFSSGTTSSGNGDRPASISQIRNSAHGDFFRVSSTQAEGNKDYISINGGQSVVIFDVSGSGVINRFWLTALCADPSWPRALVVEMYWDGQQKPSVRAPLGDFFGAGMGARIEYSSDMQAVLPYRATGFNSYWPMPFAQGAKIVVRNESILPAQALYFQVDYEKSKSAPTTPLRFHAGYRQSPARDFEEGMKRFEIAQLHRQGCFAGYSLGIHNPEGGWFGEGDEILDIDGRVAQGTGLEDAIGMAWRPESSYSGAFSGFLADSDKADSYKGFFNLYRFYLEPPICFDNSMTVAFERRPQDDWSAVSYWYQPEPGDFPPEFPPLKLREPPRSADGLKSLEETRRLYAKVYKIAGWPDRFTSFDSVGDLIRNVDALFTESDYAAALRLLKAAAREQ